MGKIKVMVVDDHALFRNGLARILATNHDLEVIAEVDDGQTALKLLREKQPDIILMDLHMKEMDGLEATKKIKQACPEIKVVILTVSEEEKHLWAAIRGGADGYILKNIEPEELHAYLKAVFRGETPISGLLAKKILFKESNQKNNQKQEEQEDGLALLTPREAQVLELVGEGLTNQEIAQRLCISKSTVKVYLRNVMDKLHLKNRVDVAVYATRNLNS